MPNKSNSIPRSITQFNPDQIRTLYRSAKTVVKEPGIEIRRAPQQNKDLSKTLIVIPRAVGTAVERNLLRRQIKSIFYQDRLFENPFDLLILLKKGGTQLSFDQLTQLLTNAVSQ